jgi:cell division protease FtsH
VLPPEGDPRLAGISEELLNTVDEEARRLIEECYQEARRLLSENRNRLDAIAEQLLLHETLDEADVYAAAGVPHEARAALAETKALPRHSADGTP